MSPPLRIAFTGTGHIAQVHAQAAQQQPGVELSAVVNHRPESLAAFAAQFGIHRLYRSLDALLQDGGVEALIICTPNFLHAPQAITALQAGLAVLVEKPMALNAAEAQAMLAASQESGALLMAAHCLRFHPEIQWLRGQILQGRLGRIVRTKGYGVHAHWGPSGWFTQAKLAGGGALADMGIHAMDAARFLLGDPQPVSVYAHLGTYYLDVEVEDTGMVLITWEGGAASYIESGWQQPHADGRSGSTQVFGAQGYGSCFPTRLELPTSEGEVQVFEYPFPPSERGWQPMYEAQMAYFIHCVRENVAPSPGGAEGLVNMRILEAAYASARSGQAVRLPADPAAELKP